MRSLFTGSSKIMNIFLCYVNCHVKCKPDKYSIAVFEIINNIRCNAHNLEAGLMLINLLKMCITHWNQVLI